MTREALGSGACNGTLPRKGPETASCCPKYQRLIDVTFLERTPPRDDGIRHILKTGCTRPQTQGQALTEFILVIPLFFLLLLAVVQLSMLSFAQQVVHYAAFAATRAAIVRPCMAFHPNDAAEAHFTPTVYSAAVLATLAAAPAQELFGELPYGWLPVLPAESLEVQGLNFEEGTGQAKYANAAYLTAVRRVEPLETDPVTWEAADLGPGPGMPCANWDTPTEEYDPIEQNVPPSAKDLSLEVTFLYPMRIPIVNRVFYGIFVNFSSVAQDALGLLPIQEPSGDVGDVMTLPLRSLPSMLRYRWSVLLMVNAVMTNYGFAEPSRTAGIADILNQRQWYPIPVRARCTLTVEGALHPLVTFSPLIP